MYRRVYQRDFDDLVVNFMMKTLRFATDKNIGPYKNILS